MNQKEYKEIARIIKKEIDLCNKYVDELNNEENLTYRAMVMREINAVLIRQAHSLADYFEREDEYCGRKWGLVYCDEDTPCYKCKKNKFNKEQFLKEIENGKNNLL